MNLFLKIHIGLFCLSYISFLIACITGIIYLIQIRHIKSKHFDSVAEHFPSLNFLDFANYHAIVTGFVLFSMGIIAGIFLIKSEYGKFFAGTFKELLSFITWIVYGLLVYLRLTSNLRGKKVAIFSLLAFCLAVFTYFIAKFVAWSY